MGNCLKASTSGRESCATAPTAGSTSHARGGAARLHRSASRRRGGAGGLRPGTAAAGTPAGRASTGAAARALFGPARALAAALLPALLGALVLPAPAQAQTTCTPNTGAGEFWCGVVTVGEVLSFGVPTSDGFWEAQDAGDLSDEDFEFRGNSYTIEGIVVGKTSTTSAGYLSFRLDRFRALGTRQGNFRQCP